MDDGLAGVVREETLAGVGRLEEPLAGVERLAVVLFGVLLLGVFLEFKGLGVASCKEDLKI